jgi:hypothetical protein
MSRFNVEPQGPHQAAGNSGVIAGRDANISGNVAIGNARLTQRYDANSERIEQLERLVYRLEAGLLDQGDMAEIRDVLQQEIAVLRRDPR